MNAPSSLRALTVRHYRFLQIHVPSLAHGWNDESGSTVSTTGPMASGCSTLNANQLLVSTVALYMSLPSAVQLTGMWFASTLMNSLPDPVTSMVIWDMLP